MLVLSLPGYIISLLSSLSIAARGGAFSGLGGSIVVMTVRDPVSCCDDAAISDVRLVFMAVFVLFKN